MTLAEALQDALARIVSCREAVELGEYGVAAAVLHDLELDLAVVLEQAREEAA